MPSYLVNPFSPEAEDIAKKSGNISDFPESIFELAEKKVSWKDSDKRPPKEILELEPKRDVLSYYLLFLSAGLNFSPYSNEVRLVKEIVYQIARERLMELARPGEKKLLSQLNDKFDILVGEFRGETLALGNMRIEKKEIYSISKRVGKTLDEKRIKKYGVPWKTFLPLLRAKEIKLADWDVRNKYIILSLADMIEVYSRLIALDSLEKMASFRRLEGTVDKWKLEEIKKRLDKITKLLSSVSKTSYKVHISGAKAARFSPGNFPPCIKGVLDGVSTGSRNYAISVLLTSFLSYARAAPSNVQNPKLSDFIKDQTVLQDEIMPLIYQAAERCQPPLLEDQPIEKLNIAYHLGLGLTEEIKLENSGNSKWYFPPNCEKVQREAPSLCVPDELCEKIKNPLNYYFLKAKIAVEEKKEQTESQTVENKT